VTGKQLIEIGTQIGAKQGVKQGLMNTANKMLQKGFEPHIIKEITGLPDKDIKKLLNYHRSYDHQEKGMSMILCFSLKISTFCR